MGFPQNPEMQQRIVMDTFYLAVDAGAQTRLHPVLTVEKPQDVASVIRTSFGSIPKPRQLTGAAGGGSAAAKELHDFKLTSVVHEWDITIDMPRSVIEDTMEEAQARIGLMADSAMLFFDEKLISQLDSTVELGYDNKALYSTTHDESGSNQDNALTSAAATGTKPTVAELEAALETDLTAIRKFTDDQGRLINEAVTSWIILVPADFEWLYRGVLDPNLSQQAIDASGATGKFRGMFTIRASGYLTADRHFIFGVDNRRKAVARYMNKPWEFASNVGDNSSDAWRNGRKGLFSSWARWSYGPWDWKVTARHVFT